MNNQSFNNNRSEITATTVAASTREIRNLPVKLEQKKKLLSTYGGQSSNVQKNDDKNFLQKIPFAKFFTRLRKSLKLWRHTLKDIEIHFGTNFMLYFTFIKLLFLLNLLKSIAIIAFIITPNILHTSSFALERNNYTIDYTVILDIFQGTGIFESSFMFYGYYTDTLINYMNLNYNFPLAYLLVELICFLFIAIVIVKLSTKNREFHGESIYASMVFTSWVFQTQNKSTVEKKHVNISREIVSTFKINTEEENRKKIYQEGKNKIVAMRIFINGLFLISLGLSSYFIYYIFKISEEYLTKFEDNVLTTLCFQFLPSVSLTFINKIIPLIFNSLIKYELYSSVFELKTTLLRMVFVRMFSLLFVYISLYNQLENSDCWENRVGQQMYKMIITEFLVQIISIFIINILVTSLIRLCKKTYSPVFDLPKSVLDAIYMQTLTWFGMFFSPILPILYFVFTFVLIYAKRFELFRTAAASGFKNRFQTNSTYTGVLFISFNFAFIPFIFCISTLKSSLKCGPFKNYEISWDAIPLEVTTWPEKLQTAIGEIQSAPVVMAIFLILILTLYTYIAKISTNKSLIIEMRKHLSHLGSTKQHLRNIYHKYNNFD